MMNIETIQKNKLGTILRFSISSIISMLLSTIITITDGYFTGNYVGEDALAAINLGLPILYFYLGVGLCIGVGGSVLCGQLLGSQENRKASEVFSQSVATAFAVCVVTSLAVYLLFPTILRILQANGGLTLYFTQYYRVMLLNYPLMVVGTALGMFIRMDGRPQICMLVSVGSCVLNALLDYVLVARFAMGVLGSAYASLAVQLLSVIAQLVYFFGPSHSIRIARFQFDRAVHRDMLLNGSSEFIGEMASAVSMFAFNFVLMRYVGTEGVAAFTILGFAVYGFSMISIGFGQGLTVPVSICWGAGERKTAMELRIMTNRILFVIGAVFAVSFLLLGRSYAGLFGCSSQVAGMVSVGFRFFAVTFLIMGYDVINSMYFTSCADAKSSALISSLRGLILLLPFTFLFPAIWGMRGVWLATPATEALTTCVSAFLIRKQKKRIERG